MKWFNTLSHNRWLEQETDRIFNFGKNAAVPTGFGWLGNKGQIKEEMGTHLWITARMLHVYSVAASMGRPGAYDLVDHGIKAMNGALRIASVIIHDVARNGDYRVNEHFDSQWNPIRDYNKDNPAHRFRAYGGTPGHWIEWGRLMLHLHAALEARFETPPAWLLEDAKGLFHATIRDAWAPDGADGFVYSVDWDGKPIVRERVRWPIVEAMGTAYALYTLTGDSQYEEWYQKWWDYCIKYLMDYENGSWWQELDADNKVTTKVWDGKQDIYHLLHCLVIPRLPLAPGLAPAVAAGLLDINAK
ncbi:AGE family epimerase/isomerase [Salmonella enterica]|nr:AGE family epimerase/isomerase [Salmonella enterica]